MTRVVIVIALLGFGCGSDPKRCGPDDPLAGCDIIDCRGSAACDATCNTGTVCPTLDCSLTHQCRLDCTGMATCEDVNCRDASVCFVDCSGGVGNQGGSTCKTDCTGAGNCSINCGSSGRCLVDCTGATACRIDQCVGPVVSCPNNVLACNRACP